MNKILFFLLIFCVGCSCDSNLYTKDGECCNYVCNTDCEDGYVAGSCNCECAPNLFDDGDTVIDDDLNLDDLFDDSTDIEPPVIPI